MKQCICSNMDEPGDYRIKWSQSDGEGHPLWQLASECVQLNERIK